MLRRFYRRQQRHSDQRRVKTRISKPFGEDSKPLHSLLPIFSLISHYSSVGVLFSFAYYSIQNQEKDVLEFHGEDIDLTGKVVVVVPKVTSDKLHRQLNIKRDLNPKAKKAMKLGKTEMDQNNSFFIGDHTEPQPPRRVIQSFIKSSKKNDPYNLDSYR